MRGRPAALVVALGLVLGACSSGMVPDDSASATRTAHGPGGVAGVGHVLAGVVDGAQQPGPAESSGSAGPAAASPVASAPATPSAVVRTVAPEESLNFVTPTKNIGCMINVKSIRCDIRDHTWKVPEKPESCEFDYGSGLVIEGGRATLLCASDTVLGGGEVLPYGTAARAGTHECVSQKAGVTCRDTETRQGFTLSRDAYSLF